MSTSAIYDPEHWRKRAEEMRALAEDMREPEAKAVMLGIADDYEGLGRRAQARLVGDGGSPT